MYPGVGPDGVYRLHAGVPNRERGGPYLPPSLVVADQLFDGGRQLDVSVLTRMSRLRGAIEFRKMMALLSGRG